MRTIEPIAKLDLAFSLFCLQHRFSYPLSRLSKAISHTGDGHLYAVLGGLAWWMDGERGLMFLLVGLLAFTIELPLYWMAKNAFKRRRPQELSELVTSFITPSDRYSLPSGHTAAAFAYGDAAELFLSGTGYFCLRMGHAYRSVSNFTRGALLNRRSTWRLTRSWLCANRLDDVGWSVIDEDFLRSSGYGEWTHRTC